jgi:hypothetical protein
MAASLTGAPVLTESEAGLHPLVLTRFPAANCKQFALKRRIVTKITK